MQKDIFALINKSL